LKLEVLKNFTYQLDVSDPLKGEGGGGPKYGRVENFLKFFKNDLCRDNFG
jgi:hypothetical protein